VLYFPVYALLFADSGLSATGISSLLVLWSVTAFVLEIPSGAWADAFSRRWLLAGGGVLRAIGFAGWTLWPTYVGFAIGFLLWGIRSATSSGTREALLYDELAEVGAEEEYLRVRGRAGTIALASMMLATALAAPAYAIGGYALIGAASVAVCLGSAAVALSFPETPRVRTLDGFARYASHLRAGLREARRDRRVRGALLLAAAVPGLSAVDEYLPLLAR
jgi:MFS family permease